MKNSKRLILASTSEFRRKLMEDAGFKFETMASEVDEKSIVHLPPRALAKARAELKGLDVAKRASPNCIVIGADQVLSLDGEAFDKAGSSLEAKQRLRQFSGRTHFLHSAYCLLEVNSQGVVNVIYDDVVDVPMTMRTLSDNDVENYVATDEWKGCVGCYRIEGRGIHLFANIGGDHSAIIGLPLVSLIDALEKPEVKKN